MADNTPDVEFLFPPGTPDLVVGETLTEELTPYDLRFSKAPGTANLVFGSTDTLPPTEVTIVSEFPSLESVVWVYPDFAGSVVGVLPELESNIKVLPDEMAQVDGTLPGLESTILVYPQIHPLFDCELPGLESVCEAVYDARVSRPTVNHSNVKHQVADKTSALAEAKHQNTVRKPVGALNRWQVAGRVVAGAKSLLPNALQGIYMPVAGGHQQADQIGSGLGGGWKQLDKSRKLYEQDHQVAKPLSAQRWQRYQDMIRTKKFGEDYHHQVAKPMEVALFSGFHIGKPIVAWVDGVHQDAVRPQVGPKGGGIGPNPNPTICYTPSPHLVFSGLTAVDWDLTYVCEYVPPPKPEEPKPEVIIPVKKAYIVMNEVRLFKVDGNVELPVISLSLDVDMDSWTWGFSVTLPAESLSYVSSTGLNAPVELEAVVNGESYLLLAESVTRNRSFGRTTVQVSGRGQSAYLSSPYSPVMNFANTQQRTAQQLIADALTTNGVSIGWEVEWGITDWVVPGNVWSQRGTYIDAVNSIVRAAGAHVLPHPSLKKLQILPRYPVLPWNWETTVPNIELPSDLVETEAIKWIEKPAYNGVYVSGTSNGVLGYVKRTGTAGDYLAEMVTDSLITHADAARQRGQTILADTGRMAMLSLSLPVLPETGIIKPGKMVRYMDAGTSIVGLVKGVSVSMSQQPVLRQTIEVEAHV